MPPAASAPNPGHPGLNSRLASSARWPLSCLAFAGLLLPWLSPWTFGPSAAVLPWLLAAACTLGLCWLQLADGIRVSRSLLGLLGLPAAWIMLRAVISPEPWLLDPWAALGALALIAGAASLGGVACRAGSRLRWRQVEWAWLAAALASSMIGLLQYLDAVPRWAHWINQAAPGMAYGNLRQPNQLATLLSLGLAVLVAWSRQAAQCADATSGRSLARWAGTAAPLAVLALALGAAASASRTGLLQWLGLCLWAAWPLSVNTPRSRFFNGPRRLALWALVAYGLASWVVPELAGTQPDGQPIGRSLWLRLQEAGPACTSRLTLWSNVLALVAERPLLGWGWGELDWAHLVHLYAGPRFCDILDNAHNLPLHLAVELGLPFTLLWLALLAVLVWRARPWRETQASRQLAWAVLALIALHSLLEYPLWYGPFQLAAGLALGLLWPTTIASAQPGTPWHRTPPLVLLVLLSLAWAYAAWDYRRVSQVYLPPAQRAAAYRAQPLQTAQASRLYQGQVEFAQLSVTPLNPANAAALHRLAGRVLHYSPEPLVLKQRIRSAELLEQDADAEFWRQRQAQAFPSKPSPEYAPAWPRE